MNWLFHPSQHLTTRQLAIGGGLALLATAALATLGGLVTDGVLDLHFLALSGIDEDGPPRLIANLLQGGTNLLWLTLSLWLAARVIGCPIRADKLLAHQAFARWPVMLACLYLSLPWVGDRIYTLTFELLSALPDPSNPVMAPARYLLPALELTALSVPLLFCMGWMIWLMYEGYRSLIQASAAKPVISFVIALIVAELLSKLTLW